jgi:ATP-dependent Clp protease ATP-binding subunit ClpC
MHTITPDHPFTIHLTPDLADGLRSSGVPVALTCRIALAAKLAEVTEMRAAIAAIRDPTSDVDGLPSTGVSIVARCSPRVFETLDLTRKAAEGSRGVGTCHLLIGLIDQGANLGVRVLRAIDIDTDALRAAAAESVVEEALVPGGGDPEDRAEAPEGEGVLWHGLTLPTRLAIAHALEVAILLNHEYLGHEHLLFGLLDQEDSGAGRLLREFGVTPYRAAIGLAAYVAARR